MVRKSKNSFRRKLILSLSLFLVIIVFFYLHLGFYFGLAVRDGKGIAEKQTANNFFETEKYSFLVFHSGALRITDKNACQYVELDARTIGCKDTRTYLEKASYEDGVLYTYQYKDWSSCSGNFKRKFNPELRIKFFGKPHC